MKIAVVDDSKMARKSVVKLVKEIIGENVEIFEGENGKEALFIHKTVHPDLIFLDLTMPVMTGYEALEAIIAVDPEAKVVIVTADIQPKAREKVMGLGAKAHIQKNILKDELAAVIEELGVSQ